MKVDGGDGDGDGEMEDGGEKDATSRGMNVEVIE